MRVVITGGCGFLGRRVALRLLFPDLYQDRFSVGSTVRFYEGSRLVGTGTILEVL